MGWWMGFALAMGIAVGTPVRAASPLAPYLDESALKGWIKKLQGPFRGSDMEVFETQYQTFVQPQTFRDLQAIYDPKNADKLQVAYPSFTAEGGEKAAQDQGYGLHVVKRLVIDLPGGLQKVIDVNEHWAENRTNHGLFLPDEIRIKTRVEDGERKVAGSERQYFFDSIRLAWNENNEISIQRSSRYTTRDGQKNKLKRLRVAVSAPISCLACHDAMSTLNERFLGDGEMVNREAIVQDSFFTKPYAQMHGYREYVEYLQGVRAGANFIRGVKRDLQDPKQAFAVPGLFETLGPEITSYSWLGEDNEIVGGYTRPPRQGVYLRKDIWYLDGIEERFEGKYRWWEPGTAIPRAAASAPLCVRHLRR